MLGKMLKHEFRAQARTLIPLLLATLGLGALSALLLMAQIHIFGSASPDLPDALNALLAGSTAILSALMILAIWASAAVTVVVLLSRYYRNLFTDEGYLTFTLPVSADHILISKLVSALVWSLLSGLCILVAGLLIVGVVSEPEAALFSLRYVGKVLTDLWQLFGDVLGWLGVTSIVALIAEFLLLTFCSAVFQLLVYYLSITIGSQIAKKHRILASVGVYFGINSALSVMIYILMFIFLFSSSILNGGISAVNLYIHAVMLLMVALFGGLSVGIYFLIRSRLTRHLNLE